MSQSPLDPYLFDPADPRAPTSPQWAAMTDDVRKRVVDALPTVLPVELHPPEGDVHRKLKQSASGALRFLAGSAQLSEADERAVQLGAMIDEGLARVDREAARAEAEAARAEAEAARADAAEARLAAALAEIERLKGR